MSAKTHTQKTTAYMGTDLKAGMIWVSGYGEHYLITEATTASRNAIEDGYLSFSVDHTKTDLTLKPMLAAPSVKVTVDNSDLFDILDS